MSNIILFRFHHSYFLFHDYSSSAENERKNARSYWESVKKGDKVITSSGIYGTIAGLDEEDSSRQIADNVKVKLGQRFDHNNHFGT